MGKGVGGPTLNHAVHHIDLLNWLEGGLPNQVTSILSNVMHDNSEVEDISKSIMAYDGGSLADVTASVVHHGEEQSIIVQCADAKLSAPWDPKAEVSMDNGFPMEEKNEKLLAELNQYMDSIPDLKYEGHTGEIDDVLTALENGKRPLITGVDGKRTLELITAIYKSGFTGMRVSLPIQKIDEYYCTGGIEKHAIHFYEKTVSAEELSEEDIKINSI